MMKKSGYTPFKMKGKSPMMKKLIGNQHRLPEELKAKILASPTKMMKKSPAKQEDPNLIQKQRNKINPFSQEFRSMTPKQKKDLRAGGKTKKGKTLRGAGKDPITKENITKSLGNLNKKIQDKAAKVDKFIKGPKGGSKLSVKHEGPGKTTIKRVPKGTTTTSSSSSSSSSSSKGTTRSAFETAFAKARKEGKKTFTFEGKSYTTDLAPTKMKKSAMKLKKSAAKMKKAAVKMKKSPAKMMKKSPSKMAKKSPAKKYKSDAQRKAVHASKADGGKGAPAKMMKKSPAKLIKKKTDREKLNKLVEKRTKLNKRKDEREAKGKKTKRVTRRIERVQNKINKNPKAQEDRKNAPKEMTKTDLFPVGEKTTPKSRRNSFLRGAKRR